MDSPVWSLTPAQYKAFGTMLLLANWRADEWMCPRCHEVIGVPRGGFTFSVSTIADKAGPGVSRDCVLRTISALIKNGTLTRTSTRTRCHACYVFVNYDKYGGPKTMPHQHPHTREEREEGRRTKGSGAAPPNPATKPSASPRSEPAEGLWPWPDREDPQAVEDRARWIREQHHLESPTEHSGYPSKARAKARH